LHSGGHGGGAVDVGRDELRRRACEPVSQVDHSVGPVDEAIERLRVIEVGCDAPEQTRGRS